MVKLLDRVKQAVSGTASSTTLGAAATGFRTFSAAGASTNDVCRYAIEDDNGAFEIGTIKITGSTTGTRTVELSSNSNNALTLTGNAVIFATLSASDFSGNAAPIWTTTPPSTLELANDGSTAVTLAGVAIDEFPVRYSWDGYSGTNLYDADSLPPQLASAPTFSAGTASLIGSSTSNNQGSFNFRMKAFDGVKTATAITTVNLNFGYDLSVAAYDNLSFSVASQSVVPFGMTFNSDGTKLFIVDLGVDKIFQYSLTNGFSLASGNVTYDNLSFSVGSQDGLGSGVVFNPDGTKMFLIGYQYDKVHQFSLTNGFSLASGNVSYSNLYFDIPSSIDGGAQGLAFNADGTKMFIVGKDNDKVHQLSLTNGFSLASGNVTNDNLSFSVAGQETTPTGLAFNSVGTKLFIIGESSNKVYQYSLNTGFSLASGNVSYDNVSFSVSSQEGAPQDLAFSSDGSKMFIIGPSSDSLYQYTTVA